MGARGECRAQRIVFQCQGGDNPSANIHGSEWESLSHRFFINAFVSGANGQDGILSVPVAVECDGHDFHEKTKEQAIRDKKRDRDFIAAGVPVLHFTGREIWRDPSRCVGEIGDFLVNEMYRKYAGYNSKP